uniref:PGG domain-containing protein n=1 Tax=Solanum tuberosum TaxID=4113 RepID=M1D2W2_SOLTU
MPCQGEDRRIPLDYAVIKGRGHVMKELLVASPDSAEEVSARGETCLHLAVKDHQFEAFKLLLDNLKYDLLNRGYPRKHFQDPSNEQSSREQTRDDGPRSNVKKLQDFFKYNKTKDPPGKVRDTLLVIAILIATATYQAGFNPPGGLWQDTYWPDDNNINSTSHDGIVVVPPRHLAGQSVMATRGPVLYALFLVFNSLGFFVSLHAINFLTIGFPLQSELQVSLFALAVTYMIVMMCTIPCMDILYLFFIVVLVFPVLLPLIIVTLRNYHKKPRIFLSRFINWTAT